MEGLQACAARMCVSQLTVTRPAPWYTVSMQRWLLGPLHSRSGDPLCRPSRPKRSAQMPSTLPPLDAAGEGARQGESPARIALESDPLRLPLLPGYPASELAQESAGMPAAAPSEFDIHRQIEPARWGTPDDTW